MSLHILDIVENSIEAGATRIRIVIDENIKKNLLKIKIEDNGKGMEKKTLKRVLDPFYTTKTVRRVGLGLSLFAQTVKEANGKMDIKSKSGKGTVVIAKMNYNHIDRKPLGNLCDTIMALIGTWGDRIDLIYKHRKEDQEFHLSTREIKKQLGYPGINHPEVLKFLRKEIKRCLPK
ncbi:MAG: ATP-binding protein [bacterium]